MFAYLLHIVYLQIFQASTGIYVPAKTTNARSYSSSIQNATSGTDVDTTPLVLHLHQSLHCLKYLDSNLEKIMHAMKAKDNAIVVNCVHRILLCLFLCE